MLMTSEKQKHMTNDRFFDPSTQTSTEKDKGALLAASATKNRSLLGSNQKNLL